MVLRGLAACLNKNSSHWVIILSIGVNFSLAKYPFLPCNLQTAIVDNR